MKIQLCKKNLAKLPGNGAELIETLRDREHTPTVADCVNRCAACEAGKVVASADGFPIAGKNPTELLEQIAQLGQEWE